jgi:hypothetical protein
VNILGNVMKKAVWIVLAMAALMLAGCSSDEEGQKDFPDLDDYTLLKTEKVDAVVELPGAETTLSTYGKGVETILVFQLEDGEVMAFIERNTATGEEHMYVDTDNDGKFEQQEGSRVDIYGFKDPKKSKE